MTLNFYTLGVLYLVYSFLGWVGETVVATFRGKRFANRGMAAGPFCFVYGTTAILMAVGFADMRTKPVALFVACMLTATVVEWLTAKLLERLHNRKWWDYSDMPFNIKGYVCLKFTVLWGLAASFIIGAVHRFVYMLIVKTPFVLGVILLAVFSAAFIADFIVTLTALVKLPKKLKAMAEAERALRAVSDKIGENISDTTIAAKEKGTALAEENKPRLDELKAEYEKKKKELSAMLDRNFVHRRIFKAFPNLKNGRYKAIFDRISELKLKVTEKGNEKDGV